MEQRADLNRISQYTKLAEKLIRFSKNECPALRATAIQSSRQLRELMMDMGLRAPSVADEKPKAETQNVEKKASKEEKNEPNAVFQIGPSRAWSVKEHPSDGLYLEEIDVADVGPLDEEEMQNKMKEFTAIGKMLWNIPWYPCPSSHSQPTSTLKTEAVKVEATEQNQSAPSFADENPKDKAQNVEMKAGKEEKNEPKAFFQVGPSRAWSIKEHPSDGVYFEEYHVDEEQLVALQEQEMQIRLKEFAAIREMLKIIDEKAEAQSVEKKASKEEKKEKEPKAAKEGKPPADDADFALKTENI